MLYLSLDLQEKVIHQLIQYSFLVTPLMGENNLTHEDGINIVRNGRYFDVLLGRAPLRLTTYFFSCWKTLQG